MLVSELVFPLLENTVCKRATSCLNVFVLGDLEKNQGSGTIRRNLGRKKTNSLIFRSVRSETESNAS